MPHVVVRLCAVRLPTNSRGDEPSVDQRCELCTPLPYAELRFHPGCLKEHQHSLLSNRTFQLRAAPHLRHLHNIQLHEGSDLSMLQLDSLSGDWSSGCCPPTWPLPAGVREVVLTGKAWYRRPPLACTLLDIKSSDDLIQYHG